MRRIFVVWLCALFMFSSAFIGINFENEVDGINITDEPRASYIITNVWELQNMSLDLAGDYTLANDIDASITSGWNGGAGFDPVGISASRFTGSFDGCGYKVTGLFINRPSTDNVGLFGYAMSGSSVANVGLVGGSITGSYRIGGLIGCNIGSVLNSYSSASVTGGNIVGCLIGTNGGGSVVSYSYGTGSVSGGRWVGGLVGYNYGTVKKSYASGSVTATTNEGGGLVGRNEGGVVNSYSTGSVTGTSSGGLIGSNNNLVNNCFWDMETSGWASSAGGTGKTTAEMMTQATFTAVGWDFTSDWWMIDGETRPFLRMEWDTEICNSHQLQLMAMDLTENYTLENDIDLSDIVEPAQMWGTSPSSGAGFVPIGDDANRITGTVDGQGYVISYLTVYRPAENFVGLFGYLNSPASITNVTLVNVNHIGSNYVGGFAGASLGVTIINCHSTGNVSGSGSVGGFLGIINSGTITKCSSTADAAGTGNQVGGFVGWNSGGTITNCSTTGNVDGSGNCVGGFIGKNDHSIINCYSDGDLSASAESNGGFVGWNDGTIIKCYSKVTVTGNMRTAGFVGENNGQITDCYSTGSASSTGGWETGGFGARNDGTLSNSYSAGFVDGVGFHEGGFLGRNLGTVSNCFWDNQTSGWTTSAGGIGKNTEEMMTQITFTSAGWDFRNIWGIYEKTTYPFLRPMVATWPFNEGWGQYTNDTSGNDNDGELMPSYPSNVPTWTTGISGNALDFDGMDDYVNVSHDNTFSFGTGNFSVEAWVKSSGTGANTIASKYAGGSPGDSGWMFRLNGAPTFIYFFTCEDFANNYRDARSGVVNVMDGQWHHVVGVRAGPLHTDMYVYLDGVDVTTSYATMGNAPNVDNNENLIIGALNSSAELFDGKLDEVTIWNRALNATEISEYYNITWQNYLDNESKVAMWPFNEGVGQYTNDTSGNDNDGELMPSYPGNVPAWTSNGISGNALQFDGIDDYVTAPDSPSLDIEDEVTLSVWMKTSTETIWAALVAKHFTATMGSYSLYYIGNEPAFTICTVGGNGDALGTGHSICDGKWHNIVGTYDGANVSLYDNGELITSTPHTGKIKQTSYDIIIGKRTDGSQCFNGVIDEVSIWGRALNATEILQHYQQHHKTHTLNLSLGWNLISLPLMQSDESITSVLSNISGKWDYIQAYNATDPEHWKSNSTYKPNQLNDLESLDHRVGFWINITESGVNLVVRGDQPASTSIPLYAGWNLVGYPSLTEKSISDALTGTDYDRVEGFNATAPYRISQLADSYMMKPGEGYWVHVPADTTWLIDW